MVLVSSTIIEEIEAMRKPGLAPLAMFYYDFKEDEKKDLRGLLSSVLFRLYNQSDSYYNVLSTFDSTHRKGAQSPSDNELVRCLVISPRTSPGLSYCRCLGRMFKHICSVIPPQRGLIAFGEPYWLTTPKPAYMRH